MQHPKDVYLYKGWEFVIQFNYNFDVKIWSQSSIFCTLCDDCDNYGHLNNNCQIPKVLRARKSMEWEISTKAVIVTLEVPATANRNCFITLSGLRFNIQISSDIKKNSSEWKINQL